MNYLRKLTNISDYESFKEGESYIEPHVVYISNDNLVKYKKISLNEIIPNEIIARYDNWSTGKYILSYDFDITQIDKMYMNDVEITPTNKPDYLNNPVKCVMKNAFNNCNSMFYDCRKLTSLDLSSFNTSNVTDMGGMFGSCTNLTSLDLSSFNTSNVTDMAYMFFDCSSLTPLDLSSFDTSNVTSMESMFNNCEKLTSLNLSSFNTSNVNNMNSMFCYCYSLTSLELSSFNTSNVTDMGSMFGYCSSLTSLDVSSFNTSNVTYMGGMFNGCSALASLDLSSFDASNVTDMYGMFEYCSSLTLLDLSSFDMSKVTDMTYMFDYCESLTNLNPFYNWKQGNVDLSYSPITPLAVHQLIERSMNASDGATVRTLSLNSTTKTSWENSEYYTEDLTLLPLKNITIA